MNRQISPSSHATAFTSSIRTDRQHEDGWLSTADQQRLFFRRWTGQPQQPVVIYLHGIEGHSYWFSETASFLSRRGVQMYAPDRRGAGMNRFQRGHLSSYKQLLEDHCRMLKLARSECPERPLFLMANCWGAKAAIVLASTQMAVPLSGLILVCPALSVKVDVELITKARIALSWLVGSRQTFPIPVAPDMYTDDPGYLEYIRTDPHRLTEVTASFFLESIKLTYLAWRAAAGLRLPLLVLQSGSDRIVAAEGVRRWFTRVASPDKQLRIFPHAAHYLDFDRAAGDYQAALIAWLDSRGRQGDTR